MVKRRRRLDPTHPTGTTTRAVGYIRVSTDQQADSGLSLDAQRTKLEAYAVAMGVELVAVVEDAGYSAKGLDRPGLTQALELLERGDVNAVLVAKLDRLTRSVRDLGDLIERYFSEGSPNVLLSVGDSIDTRTAGGRLVLNVLGSVSQWEREVIGERTREALGVLRRQGVRLGRAGLGVARSEVVDDSGRRTWVTVDEEATTVARIHELSQAPDATLRSIAATLTAEGRRTKRGGRWAAETVRRVLDRADVC